MPEKTLWEEFNLAERNPDQGGGILYAMRYDADRIKSHREAIVSALQDMGMEIKETEGMIGVIPKAPLDESGQRRAFALLEELSVLNETTEYQENGMGRYKNLGELSNGLKAAYFQLLDKHDLPNAYNLATMVIPQIVRDISISHAQGKSFSRKDIATIDDLMDFAVSRDRQLNSSRVVVFRG